MALPTTIVSDVGLKGYHPPFKSSGGNFYSVVRADADELDVYKASDPTDSWTVQDSGDGPVHAGTLLGFATVQGGDLIHIIAWSSAAYEYYSFNMATDQWVADQAIESSIDADQPWGSIAVRSDGDVVVVYAGITDANMGDNKERVDVNIRTGTTWGGPVALDAGGDIHYGNPTCVLGTNDGVHIAWGEQTDTSPDPPTLLGRLLIRTLNSSDSLSTVGNNGNGLSTFLLGASNIVSYDDSGTQRITGSAVGQFQELTSLACREDGSGDIEVVSAGFGVNAESLTAEMFVNNEVGVQTTAILGTDNHTLYSGGGIDGVDQDLYYLKSTDNGDNWDTEIEEIDAITVNFISTNIYVRSGNNKLAYVYDDGGVQKYNEKDLGSAGGGAISATAAMVFGAAVDLKAVGKLDATPTPHLVFSATADLKAAGGAISASPALIFAAAVANLDALGKLDASPSIVFAAASAFLRVACDQELPPDAILVQTNLSGVVADIDEPVDTPDANWLLLS